MPILWEFLAAHFSESRHITPSQLLRILSDLRSNGLSGGQHVDIYAYRLCAAITPAPNAYPAKTSQAFKGAPYNPAVTAKTGRNRLSRVKNFVIVSSAEN
ncbi:MAG TPA: hypothetical protein VGG45_10760 [Terracidiphilus sp.]